MPPKEPALQLKMQADWLVPLMERVARDAAVATVSALEEIRAKLGDRVGFSEAEAAALLGWEPHVLRDARLRGEIAASRTVNRRITYSRRDLEEYLLKRRIGSEEN